MALKSAKIVETKTTAKKSDVPTFAFPGKLVARHNAVVAQVKELEFELENDLKPELQKAGMQHLFATNCSSINQVSSVKLIDEAEAVVCFSFQNRYSAVNAEAADAVFTAMGEDINNYVVETAKASFDSKFFLDANGDFDQKAFDAVQRAMGAVAAQFGKTNPVTCAKVVTPKPTFHDVRFKKFDVEANKLLAEVLPNTMTLKESKLS